MSYIEQLRDINSRINTTNIKGKEYAEVSSRILAFWELFPNGRIVTDVRTSETRCDCRCEVYRTEGDHLPAATGHAFEEKKGTINSTSYVENCETSAIGRALGILGIGSTQAICSKEELENALALQAKQKPEKQRDNTELNDLVKHLATNTGMKVSEAASYVVEKYGNPKEMGEAAYRALIFALKQEVDKSAD